MKNLSAVNKMLKANFLMATALTFVLASGCTKQSSQNSSVEISDSNFVQSVTNSQGKTLTPVAKLLGTAINTVGGFGGNLLTLEIDTQSKNFIIYLTLPQQFGTIPTEIFDKYPEAKYSVDIDATGNSVLKLEIPIQAAIAIYKEWKNKKEQTVVAAPPAIVIPTVPTVPPVVIAPPVNSQSTAGKYSGEIINGNPGKTWCDGSFPEGYADIQANPGNYDPAICTFGYGLFGTFEFEVFSDGHIEGKMQVIYAHNVHPIGGAHIGTGTETTFNYPGAYGRLKFNNDGTVSGRIWEPKGFLSGDRAELVGGVISGRKQ